VPGTVPPVDQPGTVSGVIDTGPLHQSPRRRGFTVQELVAVIAIIGILVALTYVVSRQVVNRSHNYQVEQTLSTLHRYATTIARVSGRAGFFVDRDVTMAVEETGSQTGDQQAPAPVDLDSLTGALSPGQVGYTITGAANVLLMVSMSDSGDVCYSVGEVTPTTWCTPVPSAGATGPVLIAAGGAQPGTGPGGGGNNSGGGNTGGGVQAYSPVPDGTTAGRFPDGRYLLAPEYSSARMWLTNSADQEVSAGTITAVQKARIAEQIAAKSTAVWVDSNYDRALEYLGAVMQEAQAGGKIPVLAVTGLQDRMWCTTGPATLPAAEVTAYRQFIDQVSTTIGSRMAVVVVEPWAVQAADQGCRQNSAAGRDQWLGLIDYAAQKLATGNPHSWVYLDGSTPSAATATTDWAGHTPAQTADLLSSAGVGKVRGFVVNAFAAAPTTEADTWAAAVRARLNSNHGISTARYVVDTSRNGGARTPGTVCNQEGTRLGAEPQLRTDGTAEAWLWIKTPGEADSNCAGDVTPGAFASKVALPLIG
jgi:endoglucanase